MTRELQQQGMLHMPDIYKEVNRLWPLRKATLRPDPRASGGPTMPRAGRRPSAPTMPRSTSTTTRPIQRTAASARWSRRGAATGASRDASNTSTPPPRAREVILGAGDPSASGM